MTRPMGSAVMAVALGAAAPASAAPARYDCRDTTNTATYVALDAAARTFAIRSVVRGQTLDRSTACDFMRGVLGGPDNKPDTTGRMGTARCSVAFDGESGAAAADLVSASGDALLAIAFDPKAMTFAVISRFGASYALTETMKCTRLAG